MALTEFTPDLSNGSSDSQLLFVKLAQWLSTPINSAVDLAKVTQKGIALKCYDELLQHGYSRRDLNWVIQLEQGAPLVEEALIQLDEGYFAWSLLAPRHPQAQQLTIVSTQRYPIDRRMFKA